MKQIMFSASHRDSSWEESFTITSPHTIYHHRSDSLAKDQEIKNLLSKVARNSNNLRPSLIGFGNRDIIFEILKNYNISPTELREIEAFFHLSLRSLLHPFEVAVTNGQELSHDYVEYQMENFIQELDESLRQNVRPIEKAILASLFLDRNQIPARFQYIYDLTYGTMYLRCNSIDSEEHPLSQRLRLIPSKHWKIPLPNSLIKKRVSFLEGMFLNSVKGMFLNSEIDSVMVKDLETSLDPLTESYSYYHINKGELIERVRHLLCRGLFDDKKPRDMEEVEELYDRLLNYKGITMWQIASNQFPNNEIVFLWNRSITSQSLEEAWNLGSVPERMDGSIPNFKVTHHRNVRNVSDGDRLVPIVDTEIWTNDQLRDALGYDWMFDQNLTLEDNWMDVKRETDLHKVREMLVEMIASNSSSVTMILKESDVAYRDFMIQADNGEIIIDKELEDLQIKTSYQTLYLEQLNPGEMSFPFKSDRLPSISSDNDEKELVEEVDEQQLEENVNEQQLLESDHDDLFAGQSASVSIWDNYDQWKDRCDRTDEVEDHLEDVLDEDDSAFIEF